MKKFLPFVNKPAEEIEVVGNENTGQLHLVKRHGITPNENPSDFQLQQKKQQKFLLKLTQRIKELAREEGIPVAEMRKRVMGGVVEEPSTKKDDEPISPEVVDEDEQQLFDYLDEETAELLFNLQEDKARLAIRAATFMLQYRVVYPIVVLSNAVSGSKSINIESPQMVIDAGTSIHFGGRNYLEVSEQLIPNFEHGEVLSVNQTSFEITENDVGFLCVPGKRILQKGHPGWTEDDTRTYLSEEMIALLFNFYQVEAGVISELPTDEESEGGDEGEEQGNLLTPSNDQSLTSPSTGGTFTTDSNGLGSETNGSTTGTLETSPVG